MTELVWSQWTGSAATVLQYKLALVFFCSMGPSKSADAGYCALLIHQVCLGWRQKPGLWFWQWQCSTRLSSASLVFYLCRFLLPGLAVESTPPGHHCAEPIKAPAPTANLQAFKLISSFKSLPGSPIFILMLLDWVKASSFSRHCKPAPVLLVFSFQISQGAAVIKLTRAVSASPLTPRMERN